MRWANGFDPAPRPGSPTLLLICGICQAPKAKIFRFSECAISAIVRQSRPAEGRARRHDTLGTGCDGRCRRQVGSVIPEKWKTGFPIRITLKQSSPDET